MTKLNSSVPLPGDEAIKLNQKYVILVAETFISDVAGYEGVRVTLDGGIDNLLAIPLWQRQTVGRKSKLGAFLAVLGNDTDSWIGKTIKFVSWQPKARVIELVEEKKKKSSSATG